jgi:hypothetical protein
MSSESVVYYLNRPPENDPSDEAEWLSSALGRYTGSELRELLYIGEEPGFFELMRVLFALSDESRSVLQRFLATADPQTVTATIDQDGRCILSRGTAEQRGKTLIRVAH